MRAGAALCGVAPAHQPPRRPAGRRGSRVQSPAMTQTPDWLTEGYPELRAAPPWVMQEMIESQPDLLEQIATASDTAALALLLKGAGPHHTVGCGTSEHASLAVAEILTEAGTPVTSLQAFEAALSPPAAGSVTGISHSGSTWATNEALRSARAAGRAT